jgi:predicted homoserine dehydrogenase-like protein
MPGDTLDGLGGFTVYGLIETVEQDAEQPGIPICLANEVTVKAPIRKDQKVLLSQIDVDAERPEFKAYRQALQVGATVSA